MRKLTGVLAAIFTFLLSVSIYFVCLNSSVDKSKSLVEPLENSSLPVVSLCEAQNLELYRTGELLRLKGYLWAGKNGNYLEIYDFENACRITSAALFVWGDERQFLTGNDLSAELRELIKQLSEQDSEDLSAMAKVEVTGKLKKREPLGFIDSIFYVNVREIKQISPIVKINVSDIIYKQAKTNIIENQ
jgi:hypothetical protein